MPVGGQASGGTFWHRHGLDVGGEWGVSAGALEAMGTSILAGRALTSDDVDTAARVALLTETGLRSLWPGLALGDAVGLTVSTGDGAYAVIGVVSDIRSVPGEGPRPGLFVPITSAEAPVSQTALTVVVRMVAGEAPSLALIANRLAADFGTLPLSIRRVGDDVDPWLQRPRFLAGLFGGLAAITILLAAVGVHAVGSVEIARRRFELGVRLALGSTYSRLIGALVRPVVTPVAVGSVLGATTAWMASTLTQRYELPIDTGQPWVLVAVVLVLTTTAVLTAAYPAIRVTRVNPTFLLRQ
jgi:ABC-type antimicrobial peptide transport system permease subunit